MPVGVLGLNSSGSGRRAGARSASSRGHTPLRSTARSSIDAKSSLLTIVVAESFASVHGRLLLGQTFLGRFKSAGLPNSQSSRTLSFLLAHERRSRSHSSRMSIKGVLQPRAPASSRLWDSGSLFARIDNCSAEVLF